MINNTVKGNDILAYKLSKNDYALKIDRKEHFINDKFIKRNFLLQNGKDKAEAIFALVNFSPYQIIVPNGDDVLKTTEDAYGNTWLRIRAFQRRGLLRVISDYRTNENYLVKELMPTDKFKQIAKQYINSKEYYQHLLQELADPHYLKVSDWQKIVRIVQNQPYHFQLLNSSFDEDKNGISLNDVRILLSLKLIQITKRDKTMITFKPTSNAKTLVKVIFNHISEAKGYVKKIDKSKRLFDKLLDTDASITRFFVIIVGIELLFIIASTLNLYFIVGVFVTWLAIPICYGIDMFHKILNKKRKKRVTKLYEHDCRISRLNFFNLLSKYHLKLHGNLLSGLFMSGASFLFN